MQSQTEVVPQLEGVRSALMATAAAEPIGARCIRVWFAGSQAFINHREPSRAEGDRYAAAMQQRFRSCRVTNDPWDMAQQAAPPGR